MGFQMKLPFQKNNDTQKDLIEKDKNAERLHEQYDESSVQFDDTEQKEIVRMIEQCAEQDSQEMSEWADQRKKDIQMYEGERPSVIEELDKDDWQADRNLGITAAVCDAYQATLLSTTYNPDTIHFVATEENDRENKENLSKFTKWGLGKTEADFFPQVDDFIHNRVTQGVSYFKVRWDVKYKWVDRRIPKYEGEGSERIFKGYDIKTEYKRFEKGVIENIDNVDDLLFPTFGDNLQEKAHLIHVLHKNASDLKADAERGAYLNVDENLVQSLKQKFYDERESILGKEKSGQLGLKTWADVPDTLLSNFPVDVYEWYGPYEKNGKREEWRFAVCLKTKTFLSGKPLRKITRTGKRPFVGSGLIRRPGLLQGKSIPWLIYDPANALNNIFNQKSDFQFVENCPTGFYTPDERFMKGTIELAPGKLMPTSDPNSIVFPNFGRSLGWAETDINILLEIIERLTGAASYFMSNNQGVSGTATRDVIINEKSETRFGLWVKRIITDISEAISMWINYYQDWAPPDLGSRVIGEDGKRLFKNLSIETLVGNYDAQLSPDVISGSKTLEKEIALWGLQQLGQSIWFHPEINAKGSWKLHADAAKKMGLKDIESYMPPEPKGSFQKGKEVGDIWTQLKQGDVPEIEEIADIPGVLKGLMEIREQRFDELDKEYHENFKNFFFNLYRAYIGLMRQAMQERIANQIAMQEIDKRERGLSDGNFAEAPGTGGAGGSNPKRRMASAQRNDARAQVEPNPETPA